MRRAPLVCLGNHLHAIVGETLQNLQAAICRTIIDDDQLQVAFTLGQYAMYRLTDIAA